MLHFLTLSEGRSFEEGALVGPLAGVTEALIMVNYGRWVEREVSADKNSGAIEVHDYQERS